MDPSAFFTGTVVHLVAGKGGVGRTTLTAALGIAAARVGLEVLLVEIAGRGGLAAGFGHRALGYEETVLAERIRGRSLQAEDCLVEYLGGHGLGLLTRPMIDSGLVEVITRGTPGIKDILLLGKIRQLEQARCADVILVDTPASGHALSFLRSPQGLLDAIDNGPVNDQAIAALQLLQDAARCQVLLVTTPEETPVSETIETAYRLEDEIGLHLGPVLVNGVLARTPHRDTDTGHSNPDDPDPDDPDAEDRWVRERGIDRDLAHAVRQAAMFGRRRRDAQRRQVLRLTEHLPLPRLEVAHRPGGIDDLGALAEELLEGLRAW